MSKVDPKKILKMVLIGLATATKFTIMIVNHDL